MEVHTFEARLLGVFVPRKTAIPDDDVSRLHALDLLSDGCKAGLRAHEEALDALQADNRIGHHGGEERKDRQREAQQGDERKGCVCGRRRDDLPVERVAHEGEQRHDHRADKEHRDEDAQPECLRSQDARLLVAELHHLLLEGGLPRVELDHLDAGDELVHDAHTLVRPLHQLATEHELLCRKLRRQWDHDDDDAQADECRPADLEPQ
mmetsp:Transcript_16624/g.49652  ORF Transcript_16624/g.49652 Transcript_16624/m.49652 type:complete len:208 (+) Transcript_16624:2680-3303(+)